ncbi:MAG: hypothetical protein R2795_09220 [Saprospiraceae bacterium]
MPIGVMQRYARLIEQDRLYRSWMFIKVIWQIQLESYRFTR